jgi:ubiquinone/menaquinone biosynthesis C-methylase UbiE
MFSRSAEVYDTIHESFHDFATASDRLLDLIRHHVSQPDASLLDVACGTGAYLVHLRKHVQVEGRDLNPAMLAIAQ